MPLTLSNGKSVVFDERMGHKVPHCFLIVTPKVGHESVFVNFSSIKPMDNPIAVIEAYEHAFLSKQSHVPAKHAKVLNTTKIEKYINSLSDVVVYERMTPELQIKILSALLKDKSSPADVKKFIYDNFGGAEYQVISNCIARTP